MGPALTTSYGLQLLTQKRRLPAKLLQLDGIRTIRVSEGIRTIRLTH